MHIDVQRDLLELVLKYGDEMLSSSGMQAQKYFRQHGGTTCYEHCLSVAYVSLWLAKKFNVSVDTRSLVRGALLHDYYLYDWHVSRKEHKWHGVRHARTALENARRDFMLNKIEMDIIVKHMFPLNVKLPRYKESTLVCLADKICATFEFCSVRMALPAFAG